jgi:hypothetical protein
MNDLFKYHGFWSVGVRLFRSLRFVSKAVVISAVFLVVVAQLAFLFIHASGHDIDFAQREVEGLRRVESLSGLLMDSQDLRRLMHAADQPAQAKALQTRRRETEARLDKLAAAMAADPALAEAMKFVQDAYAPLKADMSDRDEAFSRADEFVQQVLRLTAAVSDLSGLSMDPEAASFHLMLAATQEIPTARRMLGRMRDLGADAMREGKLDDFRGRYLQGDTYIMYSQLETLFTRYERVTKDRSDVAATLAVEEALKPINVFMRAARKGPLASGGPRGEMAAYVAAGDAAGAGAIDRGTHQPPEAGTRYPTGRGRGRAADCGLLLLLLLSGHPWWTAGSDAAHRRNGARRLVAVATPLGPGRSRAPDDRHANHAGIDAQTGG